MFQQKRQGSFDRNVSFLLAFIYGQHKRADAGEMITEGVVCVLQYVSKTFHEFLI